MVEWKTYGEIVHEIASLGPSISTKAVTLFALSRMIRRGHFLTDISKIEGLSLACPVSPYAKPFIDAISEAEGLSADESSFLALNRFYHRGFCIDVPNVDIDKTMEIVNKNVEGGEIIFPDRHGRVLYDRYRSAFHGKRLDFLSSADSISLTADTENGVYQVGHVVVGPLGILLSSSARMSPPDKKVPLWHCADPGCGVIHLVELYEYESRINLADTVLLKLLEDKQGPASDWESGFSGVSRPLRDDEYFDIIPLIADTLDTHEKKIMFEEVLHHPEGKGIRDLIHARLGKGFSQGGADKVASRLSGNQILQIVATLKTESIVTLIDKTILSERIIIPKSEIRRTKTPFPKRTRAMVSSVSSLGVRANKREPASYLAAIIYRAYQKSGNLNDLSWRCKTNDSTTATVLTYMADNGPRSTVKELVTPTREIFEHVCQDLGLSVVDLPESNREDYLLWKSGFDVARYDDYLSLFRSALNSFNDVVIESPLKANDLDRENIRAAAINAFVYAERFVEEVIAFNAWFLTHDHFGIGRFQYRVADALLCVSRVCGNPVSVGGSSFYWNDDGGNTLGTLLVFGRLLVGEFESLDPSEAKRLARSEDEYPHYASPRTNRFPFKHTQLWADADPAALVEQIQTFSSVIGILEKARTAEVRNGVQHYRDKTKFPGKDALIECASLLLRALDTADISNIVPKQFWVTKKIKDSFGISRWEMADYNDRRVTITLPSTFIGMIKPAFDKAFIVEMGTILGEGTGKLIFEHRESSRFASTWDDYRHNAPIDEADADMNDV